MQCGVGKVWGWQVCWSARMGPLRCGMVFDLISTWAKGSIGRRVVSHDTDVMTFVTRELVVEVEQPPGCFL